MRTGVIVGRFQVNELTLAQRVIIDKAYAIHRGNIIIVVGCSPTLGTKRSPLTYPLIRSMILKTYGADITVVPLQDHIDDIIWSKDLDSILKTIAPNSSFTLYGGRNNFFDHYYGEHPTLRLHVAPEFLDVSGSKVRESIDPKFTSDPTAFREGVIYSCYNQFPRAFPTTDIAVVYKNRVLMGRKEGHSGLSFPGGFYGPQDGDLESCALRELEEEFNVDVIPSSLKYVTSQNINDWRYRGTGNTIITTLFRVEGVTPLCSIKSEFESYAWVKMIKSSIKKVAPNHQILFTKLVGGKVT